MNRYFVFSKMLEFMVNNAEHITDANMKDYKGDIFIAGNSGDTTIEITVTLKEGKKNAEEV